MGFTATGHYLSMPVTSQPDTNVTLPVHRGGWLLVSSDVREIAISAT